MAGTFFQSPYFDLVDGLEVPQILEDLCFDVHWAKMQERIHLELFQDLFR